MVLCETFPFVSNCLLCPTAKAGILERIGPPLTVWPYMHAKYHSSILSNGHFEDLRDWEDLLFFRSHHAHKLEGVQLWPD